MSKNYVKEYKGCKVPEGATHFQNRYQDLHAGFYKKVYGSWFFFNCSNTDGWVLESSADDNLYGLSVELPEELTQEWVGGLPPLNSKVLLSDEEGYLFSAASNEKTFIAEDEVLIVVSIGARYDNGEPVVTVMAKDSKNLKGFVTVNPEFLEPVKTQEQEDREAFIERAVKVMNNSVDDSQSGWARAMFYAGFKAPEGE